MTYQLAVLDMAGTTVFDGDAVNDCLRQALREVTRFDPSRDRVNQVMGLPKREAITRLLHVQHADGPDTQLVERALNEFERRMLQYYRESPLVRPVEGATRVFGQLRERGIKVGLDTGFSRRIADAVIERLEWTMGEVIDAYVASDDVAAGRPAPDMIYRLMELTGVSQAAGVIKVGDTPADLLQGAAAGCGAVIGVTSGSHTADELRPYPHTALIDSIRDLPPFLSRRAGN